MTEITVPIVPTEHTFGAIQDLDILCDNVVFHVNRAVLSEASPVWRAMLGGDFRESAERVVHLNDDTSDALFAIFSIIYSTQDMDVAVAAAVTSHLDNLVDKYHLTGVTNILKLIKESHTQKLLAAKQLRKLINCQLHIELHASSIQKSTVIKPFNYKAFPILGTRVRKITPVPPKNANLKLSRRKFCSDLCGITIQNDEDNGTDIWVKWDNGVVEHNLSSEELSHAY